MSSLYKNPRGSNNGATSSSQKKPSLPARVIRWTAVQVISFVLAVLILGIWYAAVTWTNIPSGSWAAGQPVTQTLIQGIINNMNYLSGVLAGVDTRLDTLESGQTTGGTVTGPLRWSSEYSGQNYEQAWSTCAGLSPSWSWRIPSENEIEISRHLNTSLFMGNKLYWSSGPSGDTTNVFLAWSSSDAIWGDCGKSSTSACWGGSLDNSAHIMTFRCVSNS